MDMGFGFGFTNIMFIIVPIFISIIFFIIISVFIFSAVKGAKTYKKNNASPVLTVEAKIVSKRADVTHHTHHNENSMDYHSSSTDYFVTFEVESGDRLEFEVKSNEYGFLVEGDKGKLTFQGTRYKGFERNK
ncbi:MAG: DUF2500 domain-containing protein [Oscillospiraceae bacterium]